MFYRCISEDKFLQALNTIKLDKDTTLGQKVKTDEDVKKLAKFSETGEDIQKWGINIKSLLGSIIFDQTELDNAQCKIAFSND